MFFFNLSALLIWPSKCSNSNFDFLQMCECIFTPIFIKFDPSLIIQSILTVLFLLALLRRVHKFVTPIRVNLTTIYESNPILCWHIFPSYVCCCFFVPNKFSFYFQDYNFLLSFAAHKQFHKSWNYSIKRLYYDEHSSSSNNGVKNIEISCGSAANIFFSSCKPSHSRQRHFTLFVFLSRSNSPAR